MGEAAMAKQPTERPEWVRWLDAGDVTSLRQWLDRGGNVEDEDRETRNTPIVYAASSGQLSAVHLLLAHGADAAKTGAFLVAVCTDHTDIARLLLPLTDDLDFLEQSAGVLAEHIDDAELEELVEIKLKRLRTRKT